MEPPPLLEELKLIPFNNVECRPRVGGAHVMILPKGRRSLVIAERNEHLTAVHRLNVDMRWLVLARRGVDIDAKSAFVVDL
jgi:hypothetical protein